MTSKYIDLEARKDRILALTISQYIDTVTPVSSSYIAKRHFPNLSSATIRNILAELENDGFLTHPHTSAGRVPTQKGYRYYVDNLMDEIQLLEDEKRRIYEEYNREVYELEMLLDKASGTLSNITHYTSIISVDGWGNKIFCRGANFVAEYPDFQDIKKISNILYALDEKERLLEVINRDLNQKVDIIIGQELKFTQINNCSLVISSFETKAGPKGRLAVLGPTRMKYERVVSALDYFSSLINEIL